MTDCPRLTPSLDARTIPVNLRVESWAHAVRSGSRGTLFVTDGCAAADSFDLLNNARRWHGGSMCNATGGGIPVLGGSLLFARSFFADTVAYDAATGKSLGVAPPSGVAPAIAANVGYHVFRSGDMQAIPNGMLAPNWTFGGKGLVTPPIVAGNTVVVAGNGLGLNGTLWVLDAARGAAIASAPLPGRALAPDEWNYSTPLTGLAVADGMIFVPTSAGLVAY
jgi:outer membrane protein assembly factor BamB